MVQIFISYRREDSRGEAGRINDRLADRFGSEQVFMDVDGLRFGEDFVTQLIERVDACDILLAIVGPGWADVTDRDGSRRLNSESDLVRVEIATALKRGIPVIPILLDGASMPRPSDLPDDLSALSTRQGLGVRHESFRSDMDRLIGIITDIAEKRTPGSPPQAPAPTERQNENSNLDSDSYESILVVDDDRIVLQSVSSALQAEGYEVRTCINGQHALEALADKPADLGIFDIKMPRMDGMELLRRVRQTSEMPVIILSSKDEEIDQVLGLKMGADDYVSKPFARRLLVERVRTVLRRAQARTVADTEKTNALVLQRDKLRLDPEGQLCHWNGQAIDLTVTEFLILQALAVHPGVVKSHDALIDAAYDDQVYVDDRTIDNHIKALRRKFNEVDRTFDLIESLYPIGYRYRDV